MVLYLPIIADSAVAETVTELARAKFWRLALGKNEFAMKSKVIAVRSIDQEWINVFPVCRPAANSDGKMASPRVVFGS